MARPASFPLADLMAATTLDEAQARAVAACLGRELALVQGPPGTGELGAVRLSAVAGQAGACAWLDGALGVCRCGSLAGPRYCVQSCTGRCYLVPIAGRGATNPCHL